MCNSGTVQSYIIPWAEVGGSEAAEGGNEQFCRFVYCAARLALGDVSAVRWSGGCSMWLMVQFGLGCGRGAFTAASDG